MTAQPIRAMQIVSEDAARDSYLGHGLTSVALDKAREQIIAVGGRVTHERIAYRQPYVDEYGEHPGEWHCVVDGVKE